MAWTSPRTYVAGELVTASMLNTHVRDNLIYLFSAAGDPSAAWPIGSIFTAVVSTNPATLLGFGTWTAFATGRMLVGIDAGQSEFNVVEETGGAKTHNHGPGTLRVEAHDHVAGQWVSSTNDATQVVQSGTGVTVAGPTHVHTVGPTTTGTRAPDVNAGLTSTVSGLPPYIVVHMWRRTA